LLLTIADGSTALTQKRGGILNMYTPDSPASMSIHGGVLRAVNRIAAQVQRRTGKPFGQIILAAADVDADVFRQLSAAYAQVASTPRFMCRSAIWRSRRRAGCTHFRVPV
jgi:hypothetical protein